MSPTPHPTTAKAGRRTLASVLATTLALAMLLIGTPAGATTPTVARNHHLTLSVEYHVLEFNPEGSDFPADSTRTIDTTFFRAGATNPSSFGTTSLSTANAMRSRTDLTVTEKDASGTIGVKALSVLFWGNYPIAATTLTVDVLPNHWRSFWIYTDDGHHSYSHDLVTVTNVVTS